MSIYVRPLHFIRYDVIYSGELICSIPNIELGYFDTEINSNGELIINMDY